MGLDTFVGGVSVGGGWMGKKWVGGWRASCFRRGDTCKVSSLSPKPEEPWKHHCLLDTKSVRPGRQVPPPGACSCFPCPPAQRSIIPTSCKSTRAAHLGCTVSVMRVSSRSPEGVNSRGPPQSR